MQTRLGEASIRALDPEDIDAIVQFWHGSGDEFLDFLGIDRSRLGTSEDTRQRFLQAIKTGDLNQPSLAFAITLNGSMAGYTLLNHYTPESNYSHWHIIHPNLRGQGLSSALYPYRIKTYFENTSIERVIHQTRTRNIAVNRMLDHWIPVAETCHVEHPDGVALPGEFHLRYVFRKDVPSFLERQSPHKSLPGSDRIR